MTGSLAADLAEVRRAVLRIAAGRPVVLGDESGETSALAFAAERATAEVLAFVVRHGSGLVGVALDAATCARLRLVPQRAGTSGTDHGPLTAVDLVGTGTGIRDRPGADGRRAGGSGHRGRRPGPPGARPAAAGRRRRRARPPRLRRGGRGPGPGGRCGRGGGGRGPARPVRGARGADRGGGVRPTTWAGPGIGEGRARLPAAHRASGGARRRRGPPDRGRAVPGARLPRDERVRDAGRRARRSGGGRARRTGPVPLHVHAECLTGDILGSTACGCRRTWVDALARIGGTGRGVLVYHRSPHAQACGLRPASGTNDAAWTAAAVLADLGVDAVLPVGLDPAVAEVLSVFGIGVSSEFCAAVG